MNRGGRGAPAPRLTAAARHALVVGQGWVFNIFFAYYIISILPRCARGAYLFSVHDAGSLRSPAFYFAIFFPRASIIFLEYFQGGLVHISGVFFGVVPDTKDDLQSVLPVLIIRFGNSYPSFDSPSEACL